MKVNLNLAEYFCAKPKRRVIYCSFVFTYLNLFNFLCLYEDFDRIFEEHKDLCVVDPRLRDLLQKEVAGVFLPNYRRFYDKYSKIRFSKKHQNEYTKYSPYKIEEMLIELYVDPE
jgi:hypothetical protein